MLRRVDAEDRGQHATHLAPQTVEAEHEVSAVGDGELGGSLLPRDHPKWPADALTVSQRARETFARLRPIALRVLTFWDHRVRSITIGTTRLGIDAAGCYRID